ncbi:hypothetical protein LEN26_015154 [Aphanomyces euteiches]|nr:hypothetical protein LEN26_015154 [Aphanomyces euteiches]KAH9126549.1 hypothetical protein AeMF1_003035 [Aphanomyces euteiches]KAH9184939.1 hypothetical protein AeNC1_013085 [Aphanomyces euteiches]
MKGLSIAALAAVVSGLSYESKFQAWMEEHGMDFSPAEWAHRFENFIVNDQFIEAHNSKGASSFVLGHNMYSHLSFAEFKKRYTGLRISNSYIAERLKRSQVYVKSKDYSALPAAIDWVEKGAVTPVKNQGMCGSCWAFSTTGSIEGAAFVASNKLVSLSEQELVDCDHNGDMGCNGGLMDHAFKWIEDHEGLCKEEDYTYHANVSTCAKSKCQPATKVTGFVDVTANDEEELRAAVAQQPVSVAIEADQPEFQFYKSGVFDKACGTKLDHGVLVVGYGKENGKKFWKVKNSWGEKWGDAGFIYLTRETGTEQGQCGIAMVPSYPLASVISDDVAEKPVEKTVVNLQEEPAVAVQEEPIVTVNAGTSVVIVQCGDLQSELATFHNLTVTPQHPTRGQPIHFLGDGVIKADFDSAHLNIAVKLGGQLIYSHYGSVCGKTHIPLPLGLGHIEVTGLNCPVKAGNFDNLQVSLNLPKIAPEGNYEVYLTSEHGEGDSKQTVFCVQVKLDLDDESENAQVDNEINELMAIS